MEPPLPLPPPFLFMVFYVIDYGTQWTFDPLAKKIPANNKCLYMSLLHGFRAKCTTDIQKRDLWRTIDTAVRRQMDRFGYGSEADCSDSETVALIDELYRMTGYMLCLHVVSRTSHFVLTFDTQKDTKTPPLAKKKQEKDDAYVHILLDETGSSPHFMLLSSMTSHEVSFPRPHRVERVNALSPQQLASDMEKEIAMLSQAYTDQRRSACIPPKEEKENDDREELQFLMDLLLPPSEGKVEA